jgi:hypothetical protein
MRIKRKYLPMLISNLQSAYLRGVGHSRIDPDLNVREELDKDTETSASTSRARQGATPARPLH